MLGTDEGPWSQFDAGRCGTVNEVHRSVHVFHSFVFGGRAVAPNYGHWEHVPPYAIGTAAQREDARNEGDVCLVLSESTPPHFVVTVHTVFVLNY